MLRNFYSDWTQSMRLFAYLAGISMVLMILIHVFNFYGEAIKIGVRPRSLDGLLGIITHPFYHGDWQHLINNLSAMLSLVLLLLFNRSPVLFRPMLCIWLCSGLGIWLIGASGSHHIGASGLVYGLAAFLVGSAIRRRHPQQMAIAAVVAIFYGSMIWGVLPIKEGVSWEGHLSGAIGGLLAAFIWVPPFRGPRLHDEEHVPFFEQHQDKELPDSKE